jgi:hypothetical protein
MTPAARRVAISIYERLSALMEFPEQGRQGRKSGCAYREFRPYQPASLWHANRKSRRCAFPVGKHIGV